MKTPKKERKDLKTDSIPDPFEGSWEVEVGLVGPQIWRDKTESCSVAARFHKGHEKIMVMASATIAGQEYEAAFLLEKSEGLDETTRQLCDNAFRRAREKAAA